MSVATSEFGTSATSRSDPPKFASLIGRLVSSAFRLSTTSVSMSSRARASLRNRHQGPSIMGFEDEGEQSFGPPCRQSDGGSTSIALASTLLRSSPPLTGAFCQLSGTGLAASIVDCSPWRRAPRIRPFSGFLGATGVLRDRLIATQCWRFEQDQRAGHDAEKREGEHYEFS